jgi:processing peptidase subunit beta
MNRYYGAGNMILSAAGRVDHDDLMTHIDAIEKKLIRAVDVPERRVPQWPDQQDKRQDILIRELEQTHLVFGWPVAPTNDHDRWALRALSILYGGGMSSRLFQEVREKRGLCYSVFSFGQMMSDCGVFGVYAGTDAKDGNELITVAMDQLAHLAQKTTGDELERAKAQMRSAVLMGRESVMNICEMMPREWIRYGELKDANSQLDAINAIDRHHIEQLSQKILAEYPVLAAIGDSRANALMSPEKMDKLIR